MRLLPLALVMLVVVWTPSMTSRNNDHSSRGRRSSTNRGRRAQRPFFATVVTANARGTRSCCEGKEDFEHFAYYVAASFTLLVFLSLSSVNIVRCLSFFLQTSYTAWRFHACLYIFLRLFGPLCGTFILFSVNPSFSACLQLSFSISAPRRCLVYCIRSVLLRHRFLLYCPLCFLVSTNLRRFSCLFSCLVLDKQNYMVHADAYVPRRPSKRCVMQFSA